MDSAIGLSTMIAIGPERRTVVPGFLKLIFRQKLADCESP
jgi:hypothetical protein